MEILKITFYVRSTAFISTYKSAKGSDFWEGVCAKLIPVLGDEHPLHDNKGSFLHFFYVVAKNDIDHYKKLAEDALAALVAEESEREDVVISVSKPNAKDIDQLMQSGAGKNADDVFAKAAEALTGGFSPAEQEKEGVVVAETTGGEKESNTEENTPVLEMNKPFSGNSTASKSNSKDSEEKVDLSLCGQAEKIKRLKDGLLDKVKGQRHAVDEVVQTIFECEMFSANNPDRKGPLATFLFTGPSGVGKTFLAELCGKILGRKTLIVDMSEYSDNLANCKFNGEHGQSAVVTRFVRDNPNGIIIFDEVEKAHINTIHLFLQILDAARLMDHQIKQEVSFKNNIIIMTTNAGKALYDDTTVCDLSGTPRNVILEALRTEINPQTREPFFPECITTRMANGHVILFNHLEPFSLMEIVSKEIATQFELFEKSSGVKVEYDERMLSALVMYNGGGVSDARTLKGLARGIVVRELQEIVLQLHDKYGDAVNGLKKISISVDTEGDDSIGGLFESHEQMRVAIFSEKAPVGLTLNGNAAGTVFESTSSSDAFKRILRGVTDFVLIDPTCGAADVARLPNDIEDLDSEGMRMFNYVREYSPETPVYVLDTADASVRSFDTLLARGAKGIIEYKARSVSSFEKALGDLSFNALINNSVFSLGRSGKFMTFNCAQYIIDETQAVIAFEKLQLKSAHRAGDGSMIAKKGENDNLMFSNVVGCKTAKETLYEFCKNLDNPRKLAFSGKRMPKGVLLYGPPGTGKTLLAKAMANECNATFFPVSATSFFGSLVGQTENNIRELFKKARKYAPSIIFIDEVDAIGRIRTGAIGSTHSENALNTFLAEMDGFSTDPKRPVFILAATNYDIEGDGGRVLDPAFVRRFDSKILVPLPDTDARYEFLTICLKKHGVHFGKDHEKILRNMAERTGGMSNADLDMLNAQFVRLLGDKEPTAALYMDALDAYRFGDVKDIDPEQLRQTACHEAGHALVCRLCGTTPSFLTVVSRGGYGGYMESAGKSSGTYSFDELMNVVCRCLAGRVAEVEVYGSSKGINTGASSDIKKARFYVKACLNDYAMGEQMFEHKTDEEAEALIKKQYERTRQMIKDNMSSLLKLTDLLCAEKSLDETALEAFFLSESI